MNNRSILQAATLVAVFSAGALAQDKITLANGDVVTGKITSMADGKVTIASPLLGDVVVPMGNISDMVTQEQVSLETKSGDLLKRRIVGVEGGNLRLEGDTTSLGLDNLGRINPPPKKDPEWNGSLKLNGSYVDGNTDRRGAGMLFDALHLSDTDRITVDASWDYSENREPATAAGPGKFTIAQRRQGGGFKYDLFLSKKWYALFSSRVLGDTRANLSLRFTSGLGLGYTWVEDANTTFLTELGLSYLSEDYRTPGVESTDTVAARVAYRLTHKFSDKTNFVHRAEAYPSTEDTSDIYCQVVTEVVTSLTESMIASVSHILDYDNTPAPGNVRTDNRLLLSVGWSF